jgi:hypothetical protein
VLALTCNFTEASSIRFRVPLDLRNVQQTALRVDFLYCRSTFHQVDQELKYVDGESNMSITYRTRKTKQAQTLSCCCMVLHLGVTLGKVKLFL